MSPLGPTTSTDGSAPAGATRQLAGSRVLVLNWRDVRHPQAGGAEQYMHQIARRWVAAGVQVTWISAGTPGAVAREVIDGIEILRAGGPLSLYPRVAMRLLRRRRRIDFVVDCQNGIPFFAPLFVPDSVPVVQVVHHVHQDQFATRFGPFLAAVGRFLEGRAARSVYGQRPIAAVSPSTRQELRHRLGFRGPIHVVPNGTDSLAPLRSPRDPDPTVAVVSRLVPHKRIDLLLHQLATVADRVPALRVDVVGDGPELPRLRQLAVELGLGDTVRFHGYQSDEVRDEILRRAWLTTSTSAAEGWGCSVIEAAGKGIPCLALRVPGIRDSVVDQHTGWLVDGPDQFGPALVDALNELADDDRTRAVTAACQAWAACFDWDRSAELLAGVLLAEPHRGTHTRTARADSSAVAHFPASGLRASDVPAQLRPTDQIAVEGDQISLLLPGCDEVDAGAVLRRLGVVRAEIRLADRHDLLAGPGGMPQVLSAGPRHADAPAA